MLIEIKSQLQSHVENAVRESFPEGVSCPSIEIENPADKIHGEFSCNIALKSAKLLKKSPLVLADEITSLCQKNLNSSKLKDKIAKIEVKKPGFINFYLTPSALFEVIYAVHKQKDKYGHSPFGKKEKIQIEFVSANPTGPLSVAHARQAAVGDVLANILDALGFSVTREFYVNDEGNQINMLGESLKCRALQILGESAEIPEDGYRGDYLKPMAEEFLKKHEMKSAADIQKSIPEDFINFAVSRLMDVIKADLDDFHVQFNVWAHQSKIATDKNIKSALGDLEKKGFLYERDGALWFKTTDFGDDKDRVVRKSDGTYTYLAPDMAYHKDKYSRGFKKVINIWGPDHHGYVSRLKASVEALGEKKESLEILIVQLATIYKQGKPVSMSTRAGEYISLREVIDEVGVDAARFFFLMRHIKVHLDFDLELAKKETPENPVYYIQYAHARIHSINKNAKEAKIKEKVSKMSRLTEEEELELIKQLGIFPDILFFCYNQLDPYPLVSYLQDCATAFHKFYDKHRVITEDLDLSAERLALVNATRIVLANGLSLLGLSTPERM